MKKQISSPLATAIIAAASGLFGTVGGAYIQKSTAEISEVEKRKTILVEQAIKSPNQKEILEQLWFYVETGLIDDPDKKIQSLVNSNNIYIPKVDKPFLLKDSLTTNGVCGLKVEGMKPLYVFGERVNIEISMKNKCYFSILAIDSAGKISKLYPLYSDLESTTNFSFANPLKFELVATEPAGANFIAA